MANERVTAAIARSAAKYGVDPRALTRFMQIESSGDPNARTGRYKGLFQLSDEEFAKHGGQGNIYDVDANADAAAAKFKADGGQFAKRYGREPTNVDRYLVHQQGEAGYNAHMSSPDGVAWANVRRYYPSDAVAKKAIWGNVPDDVKAQYPGGVDSMTSKQFTDLWASKVNRGGSPDTMVASAGAPSTATPVTGASSPDLGLTASNASNASSTAQEPNMLQFLSALGGSGNLLAGVGKGLGMENLANAGNSNSVFGALSNMFGGGGMGGGAGGGAGGGDAGGAAGGGAMSLANNAMTAASGGDDDLKMQNLRKPMDLQMLSQILQKRGMLGSGAPAGLGGGAKGGLGV